MPFLCWTPPGIYLHGIWGLNILKVIHPKKLLANIFRFFIQIRKYKRGEPEYNLKRTQQEGRFETENWRVRKDGSKFWANIVFTAIYDDQKQLKGFSKITRDISERKKFEEEFKRLNRRIRTCIKRKNPATIQCF